MVFQTLTTSDSEQALASTPAVTKVRAGYCFLSQRWQWVEGDVIFVVYVVFYVACTLRLTGGTESGRGGDVSHTSHVGRPLTSPD